jgi:hypothetical protein
MWERQLTGVFHVGCAVLLPYSTLQHYTALDIVGTGIYMRRSSHEGCNVV